MISIPRSAAVLLLATSGLALAGCPSKPAQPDAAPVPSSAPSVTAVRDPSGNALGTAIQAAVAAGDTTIETLTDQGTARSMVRVTRLRVSLSASCVGPDKKVACAAFDGLQAIVGQTIPKGPGNPASHACKVVGASLATWKDATGGEVGVCVFSDGSAADEWGFIYGPQLAAPNQVPPPR